MATPRSIRVKQSTHVLVAAASPIDDDQRDPRKENRSGMLRLCTVTIVATPLNFSHEEKAVTVRSHGVEHAVDLLAGRYRQSCRRLLVERSQVPAGALVQLWRVFCDLRSHAGRRSPSATTPCSSSCSKRSLLWLLLAANDAFHLASLLHRRWHQAVMILPLSNTTFGYCSLDAWRSVSPPWPHILRRSNDPWAEPSRGSGRSIGRWEARAVPRRGVRRGKGALGIEIELSPNFFTRISAPC